MSWAVPTKVSGWVTAVSEMFDSLSGAFRQESDKQLKRMAIKTRI
jgi:hypothetical protein